MSANTTPSTQDLRSFLHLMNIHYKANISNSLIELTATDIHAQGIKNVNEFLQPHVMPCLIGLMPTTLASAVNTYFNAKSKSQAPKLPSLASVPPIPGPAPGDKLLRPPPGLAAPIAAAVAPASQYPSAVEVAAAAAPSGGNVVGQQQQAANAVVSNNKSPALPPGLGPNKSPIATIQGAVGTTPTTTTTAATIKTVENTTVTANTPPMSNTLIVPSHSMTQITFKVKSLSPNNVYLPGKYQRETKCRFCTTELVVGLNDYSTLLVRTTQIYDLLVHHAYIHMNERFSLSLHQQDGVQHRQPQIPYILDQTHPLPLPLPSHLTNICDGGQILEVEHKLIGIISSLLSDKDKVKIQSLYTDNETGFVDLTALSTLLSKTPPIKLMQIFENPPYPVTPLPIHDFIQGTPSGEDPSGYGSIPTCLRRMAHVCTRSLPCGCPCNGLRGELPSDCPPCPIHELTPEQREDIGEECLYCSEDICSQGPMFVSGTFQHIMPKPAIRKAPDVTLPVHEYLISLGLNGHYIDYSKTSPDPLPPFEMDNHHPSNFTYLEKQVNSSLEEYQPAGGQQLVAKQTWAHTSLPPPLSFLNEENVCKHSHHLLCFLQRLDSNWQLGNRINFNYLRCPACTLRIFHPLLVPYLVEHYVMEQYVTAKAIQRLEADGDLRHKEIMDEASEFYRDPVAFALKQYVFYLCSTCQKPYFGGTADCQMDNGGDGSNNGQLVCLSCCPTPGKTCEHSEEFLYHKCKFCCSHSTYICWSNTWFCDNCHVPATWPLLVYSRSGKNKLNIEDYMQCPSLKRQIAALISSPEYLNSKSSQTELLQQLRCDPKECPLRVAHPPNGFNFVIGCKQCETEGLLGDVHTFSSDDEDEEKAPEIIRLQGVKVKRVKAKRKKGPRMRKVAKGPSPYIVPFYEMESKLFSQLSLYSYLLLFRVLYDNHFVFPNAATYDAYLNYTQSSLASTSPLIKELLQLSGLENKVKFVDVLRFTTTLNEPTLTSTSSSSNQLSHLPSLTTQLSSNGKEKDSHALVNIGNNNNNNNVHFMQVHPPPSFEQIKNDKRITLSFTHHTTLDHNGLFYFLGTLGHTQPYMNPHKRGLLQCSSSGDQADFTTLPPWGFIERSDVRHVSDNNNSTQASYTVDLKLTRMAPTHYTLKHYTTHDQGCLRSWVMEGYSNGGWTQLDIRSHDYSINGRNSSFTFACNQVASVQQQNRFGTHTVIAPKYFTQFRIRQTDYNSRNQSFLAVCGFELYGAVELPTIHEMLLPATKHYSESARKWSEKIPREKIPESSSAYTATTLIPNVLRFVLDNGVRFVSFPDHYGMITQTLFSEESHRQFIAKAPTNGAKYRSLTVANTNFLPIQLPGQFKGENKQAFILTRNFTHNSYHNNRLDIGFMIGYNEPLLLSVISTWNSVFASEAPQPLVTTTGQSADVLNITYQYNVAERSKWPLLDQFNGAVVPSVEYIIHHYNLSAQRFQELFQKQIVTHLKSSTEQARFAAIEIQHQKDKQQHDQARVQQAVLAEEDAQRLRRQQKAEEDRLAKLHHVGDIVENQAQIAAVAHIAPVVATATPSTQLSAKEAKAAEKLAKKEKKLLEKEATKATPVAQPASDKDNKQSSAVADPENHVIVASDKKPQGDYDIEAINRGLNATLHEPILLYRTPNATLFSQQFNDISLLRSKPLSSSSGGILYYLGTLNHTDIANLAQIESRLPTLNQENRYDSTLDPHFNFTNPLQLGAIGLTSSYYPYQKTPLHHIVDSLVQFKSLLAPLNPQRYLQVQPNAQLSLNRQLVPSHSQDASEQAWIQFDFGSYRVNVNGYTLNFSDVPQPSLITDWVLEGSNGYSSADNNNVGNNNNSLMGWEWVQLALHQRDRSHHSTTNGLYHIDFANPPSNVSIAQQVIGGNKKQQPSFRYLRLRSLHNKTQLCITGIEFFGSIFSTMQFPIQEALVSPPGLHLQPPGLNHHKFITVGGKSHHDLVMGGRKLIFCDLENRKYLQYHAYAQLFFKSGFYIHNGDYAYANGGPSNGSGYAPQRVREYLSQYPIETFTSRFAIEQITYLGDQQQFPPLWHSFLPLNFASLFTQFKYPRVDPQYSCYTSTLPGLFVSTFSPQQPGQAEPGVQDFIFKSLNDSSLRHNHHFHQQMNQLSSGNLIEQLELIWKGFKRNVEQDWRQRGLSQLQVKSFNERDIEHCLEHRTVNAPMPTCGSLTRFNTAVYTSSTNSTPFLTTQDTLTVPPKLNLEQSSALQYTIPSLLTTSLSTPLNNIVWSTALPSSSSLLQQQQQQTSGNINPYVIIDMGPYQRALLSGYSLALYGPPNDRNVVYPRNFQFFGSINGSTWYIISNHRDDMGLSPTNPAASWGCTPQSIGTVSDIANGVVAIPVEDTMTSFGVPLYFPAYRFFCFISTGLNSGGQNNQLMLSRIDFHGLVVSSSSPLSTLPFPYDPFHYSSAIPPTPL